MKKQEQADILRKAAKKLSGTLLGDWLDQSLDQALSASNSDINPAMWIHGINDSIAMKNAAIDRQVAEIKADIDAREAHCQRREKDLAETIRKARKSIETLGERL
tara:strand:+ start:139 stop:453 length:315 start_codon:yes stop_codon:yes gene_type:complete